MKKNKQNLKLKIFLLIFLLLVVFTLPFLFTRNPYPSSVIIKNQLLKQGYSHSEIVQFEESLKVDQILKLSTQSYQHDALERLINPRFSEMMAMGYTATESRILSNLPVEFLIALLQDGQIDQLLDLLTTDYFISSRLTRYLEEAKRNPQAQLRAVVEKVNADRDYAPYTHTTPVDLTNKLLLINKYHYLSSDYEPKNLTQAKGCGNPVMVREAATAYDLMCTAIQKEGIGLSQWTAYRSYTFQKGIYDDYLRTYSQAYTDTFAARPGFSEHQTGLSVDVASTNPNFASFEATDSYTWLKTNAVKFGFILRYPSGKESITGYQFESWHYRYVGVETAMTITKLGITLEEYWLWIQQ